jgi:hypothetical protein
VGQDHERSKQSDRPVLGWVIGVRLDRAAEQSGRSAGGFVGPAAFGEFAYILLVKLYRA